MGRIPDDLREIIADNIRKCRKKKFPGRGGSKKCAEAFKVSPQQWSPWECGKRTPDEGRMKEIAKFFGVTVAYLREDHRNQSDTSTSFRGSPVPPDDRPLNIPHPNAGPFIAPHGLSSSHSKPDNGSPSPFDELPQIGTPPQPGAPRLTGTAPQSGTDAYWLLARYLSAVSHNGIIVRLTTQDMDYLGDCIAQAFTRREIVLSPQK